jgi:hypothetical protein
VEAIGPKVPVADKETNFWNLYNTVADEHDKEFVEKYITDLDTSLIFVCVWPWLFLVLQSHLLSIQGWSLLCHQLGLHYSNPT